MKKLIFVIVVSLLVSGCGNKTNETHSDANLTTATPAPEDAPELKDIPKLKNVPELKDTPKLKDAPKLKDSSELKDAPKLKNVPELKDVPILEDTSTLDYVLTPEDEIYIALKGINSWLTNYIWHEGFYTIREYSYTGKVPPGEYNEFEPTMIDFEENIKKKPEYDAFITELSDDKYKNLKDYWEKVSAEIDELYKIYKNNPVTPLNKDYPMNCDLFLQYGSAFTDEFKLLE